MADNVSVIFSAQIGQLIAGVDEVKQSILSIANPIASVTSALGTMGEAFAAAFAVDKIDEFFSHFSDLAVQTQRNAALLGVSTEQIAGLDIAAKSSGSSLEGLVHSMERLGLALARAGGGSAQAKAGLQALGISLKEFQGLTPEAQLETLADKFSVLKDGIDKDAIAIALLGRSGAAMIPTFNQGAAALQEFQEEAKRTGTAMSGDMVKGFQQTHSLLLELSKAFEGVGLTVASIFKPAFDGVVKILIDMAEGFTSSVREGGAMRVILDALALAAKAVATALAVAIAAIESLWTVSKAVVMELANDWRDLGKIIYSAMTFDTAGIKAAWADLMNSNRQVALNAAGEMSATARNLVSELTAIWGKGAEGHVAIEQTKNARLNILNKDAMSAAMSAAQEQIKLADMQYQQIAEKLDSQYKVMQITEGQKTQALLAALDQRHALEMAAVDKELQAATGSKANYQKVLNEKLSLDQKYAADKQKIVDQAAQEEFKTWKSGADQIAGAFNSQLKGLLSGQETFAQAMKNISSDLIIKLISDVDKWVIEWLAAQLRTQLFGNALKATDVATTTASEAAKTTAVVAGASARASAETAGATTGILAQIGNAFAVITADAAKTFAGVFAFLAPVMGPAAAGPATSAAATVEASAGAVAVPGLAVGTDMVISPGLAFLHSNEQVVPATTSGPFTGANSNGGGAQININGMLVGTQAFLNSLMPQLSRALANYQKFNPSLNGA